MATISLAPLEAQPQSTTPPPRADDEPRVFRSRFPDIVIPDDLPLHSYCFENLAKFRDKPCLIDASCGRVYTFSEAYALSRRTAAGLARSGIARGDVVMLLLHNCPEFAFAFLGASMLGAAATAANPFCTSHEISKQFAASGARLVVTCSAYVDKLRDGSLFPEDLVIVTTDDPPEGCLSFSGLLERDGTMIPEVEDGLDLDLDGPVAIPFSSGTTGLPKGVMLTHRSLITSVAQQVDGENPNLNLTPTDVVLCVLPLFHIYALNSVLLCSLRAGSAVLMVKKFEIKVLLDLIQQHRVTVAPVVPPLVLALARNPVVEGYDLSSIRMVQCGAAPLGKELEDALRRRVPQAIFGQGYGMTEAGPVLSMCPAFAKQPLVAKSGSCGTIVRNAEMKVIDTETGISLDRNQPGELCIRGKQIMKGYLNDPEATARTIDADGWLHTGDIGYVDDDGEVFIVDRVKELIKFKGFQVPPAELESLLLSHPGIADSAVVPQVDEVAGEVPVAFVVRSNNGADVTEEAIKEFVAKQVVFYKRLHRVIFTHAIPKSPSGKILRKDLKAKLNLST